MSNWKKVLAALIVVSVIMTAGSSAMAAEPEKYKVTVAPAEHGTVTCDVTEAAKDEKITVTAIPENGYRLSSLFFDLEMYGRFYNYSDDKNEYTGTMPEGDSVIDAQFVPEGMYGIRVKNTLPEGGTATLSRKYGKEGDEVRVSVKTEEGYTLENVQFSDDNVIYGMVPNRDGEYVFRIQDSDVEINVWIRKNVKDFTDVKKGSWYEASVIYLSNRGVVSGVSDTEFDPNGKVTRAQLCQTLYAIQNKPKTDGKNPFTDVPAGKWFSDAISWCAEHEYVSGYTDHTFRPNQVISRQQMAVMLKKFNNDFKYQIDESECDPMRLKRFDDEREIGSYARQAMAWAVGNELFSGMGDGRLDPKGEVTRAQMAVILNRFMPILPKD